MRTLARPMLALGLVLWAYIFVVSALSYWGGVAIPDDLPMSWTLAGRVSPAPVPVGSLLSFAPRVLKRPTFERAGGTLVYVGVLLLILVYSLCPTVYYSCFATRTEGRIIALHPASKGGLVPEVEFEAAGETYRLRPHQEGTRQSAPEYMVGDSLPVLYQPDAPAVAVVGTFSEMWGLPIFASVFATVLLGVHLAIRLRGPRHLATLYCGSLVIAQRPGAVRQ